MNRLEKINEVRRNLNDMRTLGATLKENCAIFEQCLNPGRSFGNHHGIFDGVLIKAVTL